MNITSENEHTEVISTTADDFDLREVFTTLWEGKKLIIIISSVFVVSAVIYSLLLPNIYKSTTKLIPVQSDNESGLSSLASRYGGLAAMAGINIDNGDGNSTLHAIELVKSWPYIERFVNEHNLKPLFAGVKGWDPVSDALIYDESVYQTDTSNWLNKSKFFFSEPISAEPSSYEIFELLINEFIQISIDEDTSIISISVRHFSPKIAYQLTNELVDDINEYFRKSDQEKADASIKFLQEKIDTTSNSDLREVFFNMLESQMQTLMLTEVNDQYLFKTLVPAKIAETKRKDSPKRVQIVLIAGLLGFLISSVLLIGRKIKLMQDPKAT